MSVALVLEVQETLVVTRAFAGSKLVTVIVLLKNSGSEESPRMVTTLGSASRKSPPLTRIRHWSNVLNPGRDTRNPIEPIEDGLRRVA